MKKILVGCLAFSLMSGCALWPKKVEYFQKKVKPLPVATAKAEEHQRQAADYVAVKTDQVEKAAIKEGSTAAVLIPAAEAKGAAAALTESLGPPEQPWVKDVTNLVQTLHSDQAKLNAKVEAYGKAIEPLVGLKISGTGKVSIGYFTNLAIWVGGGLMLVFLIWTGIKAYGMVNPAVGLGSNMVGRIAGKALSSSVSEIVGGGERFLTYVENSPLTADVKKWITHLFTSSQQQTQSPATQALVDKLTASSPTTAPTGAPVTTPPASISTTTTTTAGGVISPQTVQVIQPAAAGPGGTGLPPAIAAEIMSWFASLLAPPATAPSASPASPTVNQVPTVLPAAATPGTPIPVRLAVVQKVTA